MREIGSEYWLEHVSAGSIEGGTWDKFPMGEDRKYLLSGRTAIDFVLGDIRKSIKTVYMPVFVNHKVDHRERVIVDHPGKGFVHASSCPSP
jgi:hypothetical protein